MSQGTLEMSSQSVFASPHPPLLGPLRREQPISTLPKAQPYRSWGTISQGNNTHQGTGLSSPWHQGPLLLAYIWEAPGRVGQGHACAPYISMLVLVASVKL